jgi:uncharacterized DUF497 family protein
MGCSGIIEEVAAACGERSRGVYSGYTNSATNHLSRRRQTAAVSLDARYLVERFSRQMARAAMGTTDNEHFDHQKARALPAASRHVPEMYYNRRTSPNLSTTTAFRSSSASPLIKRTTRTDVCTKLLLRDAFRLGRKQEPDEPLETWNRVCNGGESIRRSSYPFVSPNVWLGGEQRWKSIGWAESVPVMLSVAHTISEDGIEEIIRIISARKATPRERNQYEEGDY